MRRTHALVAVLSVLVASPAERHWGYQLQREAGVRSGVLYPILRRLYEAGWLADGWEDPGGVKAGRPPRRYYTVTATGELAMRQILVEASADARFANLNLGLA
ncbi:MAG: PadR family transcriptional regulator [Actinomycetia bacterium]|nr:PadR family transcriptional regulator [Actinomycetes bacterium]MCP4960531.1 PadR family transcriptional regulator [Actinomycetes bacterium]